MYPQQYPSAPPPENSNALVNHQQYHAGNSDEIIIPLVKNVWQIFNKLVARYESELKLVRS